MHYLIKKGTHYSLSLAHFQPLFFNESFKFSFILPPEAWFKIKTTDDVDINKLYGRSFGLHHKNSIRLGWVPSRLSRNKVIIYAYYYNNGVRFYKDIETITLGLKYEVEFYFNVDTNNFMINLYQDHFQTNNSYYFKFWYPKFKWGYVLSPYHGGDPTATHDYTTIIKRKLL